MMSEVQCEGSSVPDDKRDVDDDAVIGADAASSFTLHISKRREQSASA